MTYALDLAVITPAAALAGVLVHRREPLGYLIAPLLVTLVVLLPTITLSTALQAAARISFTAAEVAGPIAGFGILGGVVARPLVRLLRAVPPMAAAPYAAMSLAELDRGVSPGR